MLLYFIFILFLIGFGNCQQRVAPGVPPQHYQVFFLQSLLFIKEK